jgi:neutral ceramidase
MHADLAFTRCDAAFTGGVEGLVTTPACHGISFFEGTAEGPGLPKPAGMVGRLLTRIIKGLTLAGNLFRNREKAQFYRRMYEMQWPKDIVVEAGLRKVLGTPDVKNLIFPGFIDKSLRTFKQHHRRGGLDKKPWVPQVLPLQIATLGSLALVAIPAEISTVGGRRMREMLLKELAPAGIAKVVLCPYANAYCGYITTPEEYLEQHYEAGHTVFGRYTLPAFMTHFRLLAQALIEKRQLQSEAEPVLFTDEELAPRMHEPQRATQTLEAAG